MLNVTSPSARRGILFGWFGCAVVVATTGFAAAGPLQYANGLTIHLTNANAFGVTSADLDNDGDQDVIAGYSDTILAWFEGDESAGPIGFGPPIIIENGSTGIQSVVAVDIDADGDVDVISARRQEGSVRIHLNDGAKNPSFTSSQAGPDVVGGNDGVIAFAVGDLDLDDDLDILIQVIGLNALYRLRNDGGSWSSEIVTSNASLTTWTDLADVDGDGLLDALSSNNGTGTISWYRNLGAASFDPTERVIASGVGGAECVDAADFDGDGDIDVAMASSGSPKVAWYRNDNAGNAWTPFALVTDPTVLSVGGFVRAADLDLDGDVDLLAASNEGTPDQHLLRFMNPGSGPSATPVPVATPVDQPWALAVGDLDNDGDRDVMVTGYGPGRIVWYENITSFPDCNGNQYHDGAEIAEGSTPDCNENGIPDSCDIATGFSQNCNGNTIPDECEIHEDSPAPGEWFCVTGCDADCNDNGVPDSCDLDCDEDGVVDSCAIDDGLVPDCNKNGIPDSCDLATGFSENCNEDDNNNQIPDECEISVGSVPGTWFCVSDCDPDCNLNGIPDWCDINSGTSVDCNENQKPDECDGLMTDCNDDGMCDLDQLNPDTDCDGNGVLDECDVRLDDPDGDGMVWPDVNGNGIPDMCEVLSLTGFAPDSATTGLTTGRGDLIHFAGSGFVDGSAGMLVTLVLGPYRIDVPAGDIVASRGQTRLSIALPPFPPGCDCADGTPLQVNVFFGNGASDPLDLFSSAGQLVELEVVRVNVLQAESLSGAITGSSPGECIILEGAMEHSGPVIVPSSLHSITITSPDDPDDLETRIEGDGSATDPPSAPTMSFPPGSGQNVCVSRLIIRHGDSAVECDGSNPVLRQCRLFKNPLASAGQAGGLTVRNGASPQVLDCSISGNATAGVGGGVLVTDAMLTLVDCDILSNGATDGAGLYLDTTEDLLIAFNRIGLNPEVTSGGGLYWTGGDSANLVPGRFFRNIVEGNRASELGAGLFVDQFIQATFTENLVRANFGTTEFSVGGGIYLAGRNQVAPIFCENIVAGNLAQIGGGVSVHNKSALRFERNLVICNDVDQLCTEDCEDAPDPRAPGLHLVGAESQIWHNTFHDNRVLSGPGSGGGGIDHGSIPADVSIEDNLLQLNSGWEIFAGALLFETRRNFGYDPVGLAWSPLTDAGGSNTPGATSLPGLDDPLLAGPTCASAPALYGEVWSGYALLPGSPAIGTAESGTDPGAVISASFVPGACRPLAAIDCNENGIPDDTDMLLGWSLDVNANGIPDECEGSADIDGDGTVGFSDLTILLATWGPCPAPPAPCPADVDRDTVVGFGDLVKVLAEWDD